MAKKGLISPSRKKIPPTPKEEAIVESPAIRENPVAKALLYLRSWILQKNYRAYAWGILGLFVLILFGFLVQSYRGLIHNETFYELFLEYEQLNLLPEGEAKKKQFEKLAQKAQNLCQTFWGTKDSANSCLLAAAAYRKADFAQKAAPLLERYYESYHGRYVGPFALFYSAYAYEEAGDFSKALELYRESAPLWRKIEQEDVPLFHEGRMLYYLGKLAEADKLFEKIITTYTESLYREKAQNYRLLIAIRQRNP